MNKTKLIFDCEIIGKDRPRFLTGIKNLKTGKHYPFWMHKRGHMKSLREMLLDESYTWIGFNSENFDRPLIAAAMAGHDELGLKELATTIINEGLRSWQTYREFGIEFLEYDHIDLIDVAPGVMISLKTYAGRMSHPTMMDMPIHRDKDLTVSEEKIVEAYCLNDLDVTKALADTLRDELALRDEMSQEYDIDLRSKSDAQIAEAILKKKCGIVKVDKEIPRTIGYSAPSFIRTDSKQLKELIDVLNNYGFKVDRRNGSPEVPEFLKETLQIGSGEYQVGVGGLHSVHDKQLYLEESDKMLISDFDVASYYPNIMMKAGLIPRLSGNKGQVFLNEYRKIYEARMAAKRAGNKKVANSLKITLNGTFGKLGNIYCSFYSPELMLAITITGQLNLLCLIHELEKIKGVRIRSANTDGVLVTYPPATKKRVLAVFAKNAKRTGFEYEETPYMRYAAKDVNNYIAIKKDGSSKRKGLYAKAGVQEMKNPTMEVCSNMIVDFLTNGTLPEKSIKNYQDIRDFVSIRNVKGGGIQYDSYKQIDDWKEVAPGEWKRPCWPGFRASVKRKSRPAPVDVGVGGTPFGRVARWYMTTKNLPPITYLSSGNQVPKTEGAKICMTLPTKLPSDLNYDWYVNETYQILNDLGVPHKKP